MHWVREIPFPACYDALPLSQASLTFDPGKMRPGEQWVSACPKNDPTNVQQLHEKDKRVRAEIGPKRISHLMETLFFFFPRNKGMQLTFLLALFFFLEILPRKVAWFARCPLYAVCGKRDPFFTILFHTFSWDNNSFSHILLRPTRPCRLCLCLPREK